MLLIIRSLCTAKILLLNHESKPKELNRKERKIFPVEFTGIGYSAVNGNFN